MSCCTHGVVYWCAVHAGLFLATPTDWLPEYGGFTSYIAREEDEELLTVHPAPNALALVFRDRETLKFLKYINYRANDRDCPFFFTASMMYREQTSLEAQ